MKSDRIHISDATHKILVESKNLILLSLDLLIFLDAPDPGKSAEQEDSTITKTQKSICSCLPNCDYVKYVIEVSDAREWFLGSNLQWGLKDYPRMRLKRDILFGFTDVLGK